MKPPPDLVIFDCDGVLVDSEPVSMRILLETIRSAGLSLEPAVGYELFLGRSLASVGRTLSEDFGITLDAVALAEMRQRLYAAFREELRPMSGVADTLAALRVPFCVASSSQPERVELSLRLTGLWRWFEGRAFSASMVALGKPAPDLFLFAAERMGYDPMACLVVEDSPAGVSAARAAGMRAVGFTGGGHAGRAELETRLATLEPDRLVSDMRDLVGLVHGKD
ncbi:HAD family hydrolase [uncultured Amaricoccus sp.]|uniref:HAD family hydrolase n=1 Tax=uncultured Amaricoccus sp. TaxID=339341 RepID=UPI0026136163|nr:HAD family hydrolase [uncultured Amaricoccus sp.]